MGVETPPISVGPVEAVVAVDSVGWSSQSALSPNFVVDGAKMIDATFWVPGAPGDSKDFAAVSEMVITPAVPAVTTCTNVANPCKISSCMGGFGPGFKWISCLRRFCIPGTDRTCTVTTSAIPAVTASVGGLPSKFYYQGRIDVQPAGSKAAKTAGKAAPAPPKEKAQIKVTGTGVCGGGGVLWVGRVGGPDCGGGSSGQGSSGAQHPGPMPNPAAIIFINPDPLNNGADNGDFTMLMSVKAAPVLVLPSL